MSGQCSGIYSVYGLFFCFRGGRHLCNVLTFIFHSLMKVPTLCIVAFSSAVCLEVLLSVLLLRSCSRPLRPPIPKTYPGCAQCLFLNVLLSFLLQHCPCLAPDDLVPCTMQEWYGMSSFCGQRPTAGFHHHPGFISSAVGDLQLDASHHSAPSVL
jgi:hypothetical protein